MRLTQHTDYSLRVMMYLGLREGQRVTIQEVAGAYGISQNHLMKVVQRLASLGYVRTTRGKHGGISLAQPPGRVTVGAIVRDMEDSFSLVQCQNADGACRIGTACGLQDAISAALAAFLQVLDRYTLADLLENSEDIAGALDLATLPQTA